MTRLLRAVDLFCGAGGSSTGAIQSKKVEIILAVNHWMTAIQTHRQNHPGIRHICSRADQINPLDLPDFDILIASPECTGHSNARGDRPTTDQKRASGWDVVRWADAKTPKWLIVENVREWLDWGPVDRYGRPIKSRKGETFRAWIAALQSLGYHVEWRLLNAADFGEATRRIRLFVVARRGASKLPIPWPVPTHAKENWRPAYEIIDWAKPCPSIFGRKRPLKEKTLKRIIVGLRKFCGPAAEPFIVKMRGTGTANSVGEPVPTITASGTHLAIATPFQFQPIGRGAGRSRDVTEPVPTIVAARNTNGIIMPFLVKYHGGTDPKRDGTERQHDLFAPMPTLDTQPRFALATPFVVPHFNEREGQSPRTHSIDSPAPTVTSRGAGNLCLPFIVNYFSNGKPYPISDPLSTLTCKERHGLVMVELIETMQELGIADIGFRMLEEDELARAQGFPDGYSFYGKKEDVIAMIGNAVPPGLLKAICSAIAA